MSQHPSDTAAGVPRWLVIAGSVVIVFHLSAIGFRTLAAPSGPWPMGQGIDMATPPQFAYSLDQLSAPYLQAIKLTHNYHFASDRPVMPGVYLEIRLKDEQGQEMARVRLPDENANTWVRHRQQILVGGLSLDVPLILPSSELVPARGQDVPKEDYWIINVNELTQRLDRKSVNEFDRNQMVPRPSDTAKLLSRSYARYLCRTHGADRAEIIRYHQDPISPAVLFGDQPGGAPGLWTSYFGEFTREGKPIR